MVDEPDLMTVKEYAELMRISVETVYRHLQDGLVPDAFRVGGLWRIPRPDLRSYPTADSETRRD